MRKYMLVILMSLTLFVQAKVIVIQTSKKSDSEVYMKLTTDDYTMKVYIPTKHYMVGLVNPLEAEMYHNIISNPDRGGIYIDKAGTSINIVVQLSGRLTEFPRL